MAKRGIYSLGTIRRNRIPNCKFPSEKEFNKLKRGSSCEYVADADGVDLSVVMWKDNKIVTLVSSFTGEMPIHHVERVDKKLKKPVQVPCPNLVKEYNKHMGGVDFLDSLIGRYKIQMRTKKWYMRIFYHLLDLTLVNSWILYRKRNIERKEKYLSLAEFRMEVAECLCKIGYDRPLKRGEDLQIV